MCKILKQWMILRLQLCWRADSWLREATDTRKRREGEQGLIWIISQSFELSAIMTQGQKFFHYFLSP